MVSTVKIWILKIPTSLAIIFVMASCASKESQLVNWSNYRDHLTITKRDESFYSGALKNKLDICFPPITNMICHQPDDSPDDIYIKTGELEIEEFKIDISSKGLIDRKLMQDITFFVSSGIAEQQKFPLLVKVSENFSGSCGYSDSLKTYGTISPDLQSYTSETIISSGSSSCSTSIKSVFILLKNRGDLKGGVFHARINKYSGKEMVEPYEALYYGTAPFVDSGPDFRVKNAWNNVYDARSMSDNFMRENNIKIVTPYAFKDESLEKEHGKNDPAEKSKLPSQ